MNRFKRRVDLTKFKADQMLRVNRIQGEIDKLHKDISKVKDRIAQTAFNLYQTGALSNPELAELCLEINRINQEIREKEDQVIKIKQEIPPQIEPAYEGIQCTNCKAYNALDVRYCTNCGTQLTVSVNPVSELSSVDFIECPHCGSTIPKDLIYCTECGQKLINADRLSTEG
jgi:predicted  nucleic acid-binding Zn-ribbon protein